MTSSTTTYHYPFVEPVFLYNNTVSMSKGTKRKRSGTGKTSTNRRPKGPRTAQSTSTVAPNSSDSGNSSTTPAVSTSRRAYVEDVPDEDDSSVASVEFVGSKKAPESAKDELGKYIQTIDSKRYLLGSKTDFKAGGKLWCTPFSSRRSRSTKIRIVERTSSVALAPDAQKRSRGI